MDAWFLSTKYRYAFSSRSGRDFRMVASLTSLGLARELLICLLFQGLTLTREDYLSLDSDADLEPIPEQTLDPRVEDLQALLEVFRGVPDRFPHPELDGADVVYHLGGRPLELGPGELDADLDVPRVAQADGPVVLQLELLGVVDDARGLRQRLERQQLLPNLLLVSSAHTPSLSFAIEASSSVSVPYFAVYFARYARKATSMPSDSR